MNKYLSTLLIAIAFLSYSCDSDDAAEPTVQVKFTIDNENSCQYANEADPDESIATVNIYKSEDDWNNSANAIFSGNPNANGVIDLGVLADGNYYYDLRYKDESNWEPNALAGNGPNSTFVWNRNLSLPIQVNASISYGDGPVLGKYILKDVLITNPMDGTTESEYPDSCKSDANFIEFFKDMTVTLGQKGTSTLCNAAAVERVEELVFSNMDCGDIGRTDLAHQNGDIILGAIARDKETLEVRDGKVYRRFEETLFREWEMVYEKQ